MLQSFFLFANAIIIGTYKYHGLLTDSVLETSVAAVPFAIAGILIGLKINRRFSQRRFEIILSVLIGILGFTLWVR